jgi:TonB family protein
MSIMNNLKWAVLVAVAATAAVSAQDATAIPTPTAMARATKKVTPQFPPAAKQLNVMGQQEVSIVVGTTGDVEEAKVLKGNAMFSQSSLAAVKQWKFTPLTKDGAPAKFSTVIVFSYQR